MDILETIIEYMIENVLPVLAALAMFLPVLYLVCWLFVFFMGISVDIHNNIANLTKCMG
jgi:hypothetical protein